MALFGIFGKKKKQNIEDKTDVSSKNDVVETTDDGVVEKEDNLALANDVKETEHSKNLESLTVKELKELAKEKGISGYYSLRKAELIERLK
jgi:hypothetical protein